MISKFILLFVVWVAVTNSFDIQELLVGVVVAFIVTVLFTRKEKSFDLFLTLKKYLKFIPFFIKELISSNIEVAKIVLSKDIKLDSKIVPLKTTLEKDHDKLLLSNSITLTPGTLTLHLEDDELLVHILDTKNIKEPQKDIIEKFERYI